MSGEGAPTIEVGGSGLHIEIVASLWHTQVMDGLVAGAIRAAEKSGATYNVTRVAGAFELTIVAEKFARDGVDAIAALGVVVRGSTPHFEYVCEAVTHGLNDVAREHLTPVGFGVLTVDNDAQALSRAGLPDSDEDKGAEAVEAALSTARIIRG
jgi:6,7-dimethyl-8-ribityllumazine synthase